MIDHLKADTDLKAARQKVMDTVGNVSKGEEGKALCPICSTTMYWSRSRSGRSVWLSCETEGCIYAHFNMQANGAWPGVECMEVRGSA